MGNETKNEPKEFFEQYWRYCSAMRNWLVAFGIGLCVVVISDRASFAASMTSCTKRIVIIGACVGLIVQIALVFLNKIIHWYMYWGIEHEGFRNTVRYCWSDKISDKFWIDIMADVITVVLYSCSGIILLDYV